MYTGKLYRDIITTIYTSDTSETKIHRAKRNCI